MSKILSHEELQHIEHVNKVLKEHEEIVKNVVNETEQLFSTYIPILRQYVKDIGELTLALGTEVSNIVRSTREIGLVTKNTQSIIDFCIQVDKLYNLLTPELIEKLNKVIK